MIFFLPLLMSFMISAKPTGRWMTALEVVEKHEFYQNNEVILKPKGSWQTLFAVIYTDGQLRRKKDCVYYRVPSEEPGILKIKTIDSKGSCEEHLFQPGDEEISGLKSLQYSITDQDISLYLTHQKFKIERWNVPLLNIHKRPSPRPLLSSAEYRSPKMIFLSPSNKDLKTELPKKIGLLQDNEKCHHISDDCKELAPSRCHECPEGWSEIPNGCPVGPKVCGVHRCGLKHQPACRRGLKYQRKDEKKFDCRIDNGFAYCSKGHSIQCQGSEAWCL